MSDGGTSYNVVDSERVELGRFAIQYDTIEEGGKEYPYSYVEFKECVGILPFVDDHILLINQYRHSLKKDVLEIPGGSLEKGEDPKACAIRELREETGYECKEIHSLGFFYPSPGASNEKCYLFYAVCGKHSDTQLEPLERINQVVVATGEFERLIRNNEFQHSMGIVAWMKYKLEAGK